MVRIVTEVIHPGGEQAERNVAEWLKDNLIELNRRGILFSYELQQATEGPIRVAITVEPELRVVLYLNNEEDDSGEAALLILNDGTKVYWDGADNWCLRPDGKWHYYNAYKMSPGEDPIFDVVNNEEGWGAHRDMTLAELTEFRSVIAWRRGREINQP